MQNRYQNARNVRRAAQKNAGTFRGGKINPLLAVPFQGSESGMLEQEAVFELDPIAGRLLSDVNCEIVSMYVPVPAIDAFKNPTDDYPGNAEVVRQKLMSGNPLFGLEDETEISKRFRINPAKISNALKVNEITRFAYLVACNYLNRQAYINAYQYTASASHSSPKRAVVSQTALRRMNAVLDPEDRINGAIALGGDIPVRGFHLEFPAVGATNTSYMNSETGIVANLPATYGGDQLRVEAGTFGPAAFADLSGVDNISLKDFYTAQRMDGLTREMREFVDKYPQYGEELVSRFAHGLNVDVGNQPFIMYQKTVPFSRSVQPAMDGPSLGTEQTNLVCRHSFSLPVPATEFGGMVVTMAIVRPDEVMPDQPHPMLATEWGAINYIADELAVDPDPITGRQLSSDIAITDEDNVMMYMGRNHLHKNYIDYGFDRSLDQTTVAAKTALWQVEVPLSVTETSVLYPATLDHYPFVDQNAEVCTHTSSYVATINTPMIFGPTPVEELAQIETDGLFDEE